MKAFFLAWQFLTILPGRRWREEVDARLWGQSMAFYPLIGLLMGLLLWLAYLIFTFFFPRDLADGLLITLLIILTGALHLDGLADTGDGLALGKNPEERLQIMKDHHLGTYGVISLIVILSLKFFSLNSLPDWAVMRTLLLALIISRWSMVLLTYRTPYARQEGGLGLYFKENLRKKDMVLATSFSFLLGFYLLRFWGVLIWLTSGVFTLLLQKFFEKKVKGFTGDILGATSELNEVIVFIWVCGLINFGEFSGEWGL